MGAQTLQLSAHALILLGVGIARRFDGGLLGEARVTLAQREADNSLQITYIKALPQFDPGYGSCS